MNLQGIRLGLLVAVCIAVFGTLHSLAAADDPLTLTAVQDTTLRPDQAGPPGKYPGNAIDLMIYGPKSANKDFRALIQFDLKDVPKNPVACAVLKLTFYKMYSAAKNRQDILRVHRVVRPWEELAASWGHSLPDDEWLAKGGDFDPLPSAATYVLDSQTGEAAGKTVEFEVTGLVQGWQSGTVPNYGVILMNVDGDSATTARPYSRNEANDGSRPKLILYWASPPKRDPDWIKPATLKPVGAPVQMRVEFNTAALNQARLGEKYKAQLKAKGGMAPYTFKCQGELPEGMELTPEGLLQGTPKKAGRFPLTISITDSGKRGATGKVELVVSEPAAKDPAAGGKKDDPKKTGDPKKPDPSKAEEE